MSSHSDGSYVVWNTEDSSKPAEVPMTPYGNSFPNLSHCLLFYLFYTDLV